MAVGLIALALVYTLFVVLSGSDALKRDLRNKLMGFFRVKWLNNCKIIAVFGRK